jgi:sulfatase modifying factor 1
VDMLGNAGEWASDWYDVGYYAVSPYRNPQGPSAPSSERLSKVLRATPGDAVEWGLSARDAYSANLITFLGGVRCAYSFPQP